MAYVTPRLLIDHVSPRQAVVVAVALILLVAAGDYATGYEVRLSILYLVPIALAAWAAGARAGIAAAVLCSVLWLLSFRTQHFYLSSGYYVWEAAEMLLGFQAFAWLTAKLHHALRQADERFFRVLEEMQAAVYLVDERSDEIVYANSEMMRIAGDTRALKAGVFERKFTNDAEGLGQLDATVREKEFSAKTIRDQKTGRWYLMQTGPIPWGSNPNVELKLLTDITEQKDAELLRGRHLEILHKTAKLTTLAEIASTLAHEINQPLMVIATYTDACRRLLDAPQPDHAEIAAALTKCGAQAVRAATIIERLREFIRQRQQTPGPCDANSLVSDAIDMLRPVLDREKVAVDLAQAVDGLVVVADRILLIQVMVNLMRNAIDAMRETAPDSRKLSIDVSFQEPGEVLFAVADRGCGLGTRSMEEIFSPFFTTKSDGLGLGLSICRTVAEANDGRLWAADNPGGGTIFYFSIPGKNNLS